jgi:hypothetical protein
MPGANGRVFLRGASAAAFRVSPLAFFSSNTHTAFADDLFSSNETR